MRKFMKFYGLPLLSYLDIDELFTMLIERKNREQWRILYALRERYGMKYSNGKFEEKDFPDFDNLVKLKELYMKHLLSMEDGDIRRIRISQITSALEEIVNYCMNFIELQK